jgi:hypothetical protein
MQGDASVITEECRIMTKLLGLLFATTGLFALLATSAQAWDNCGHGYHRDWRGRCHSNYGPNSGCPAGFHVGWNVYRCVPNR